MPYKDKGKRDEYKRKYRAENKEKIAEYNRKYRAENIDLIYLAQRYKKPIPHFRKIIASMKVSDLKALVNSI